jgi:serine/threonine protein kinase
VFTVRGSLYRILDTIGQGSEATVYRCEDQSATQYAVKIFYFSRFPPSELPRRIKTFKKEARILKYMDGRSRHFVYLVDYEYRPTENVGYMIMELGEGSLRQYLSGLPLNDPARRIYWKQIVKILKELQDLGIGKEIYRDLFIICFIFQSTC